MFAILSLLQNRAVVERLVSGVYMTNIIIRLIKPNKIILNASVTHCAALFGSIQFCIAVVGFLGRGFPEKCGCEY